MATFGTFVAGQVLTAAELNSLGVWSDYTPTWTQSATITKTTNFARYTQLGKLVVGSLKMTASSAGTANNKILVGLPVSASADNHIIGTMYYYDQSIAYRFETRTAIYESSSAMAFSTGNPGSTNPFRSTGDTRWGQDYNDGSSPGTQTGITIASGDIIYVHFMYEAA